MLASKAPVGFCISTSTVYSINRVKGHRLTWHWFCLSPQQTTKALLWIDTNIMFTDSCNDLLTNLPKGVWSSWHQEWFGIIHGHSATISVNNSIKEWFNKWICSNLGPVPKARWLISCLVLFTNTSDLALKNYREQVLLEYIAVHTQLHVLGCNYLATKV